MRILFNYLKDQKLRKSVPQVEIEAANSVEDFAGRVDQRAIVAETADEMFQVISAMPEDHRTVLVLRYYEELTLNEIVEVTGWRLGTVKSRRIRALRSAKMRMEQLGLLRLVTEFVRKDEVS